MELYVKKTEEVKALLRERNYKCIDDHPDKDTFMIVFHRYDSSLRDNIAYTAFITSKPLGTYEDLCACFLLNDSEKIEAYLSDLIDKE